MNRLKDIVEIDQGSTATTITLQIKTDAPSQKQLAKARHDLKGAWQVLELALADIKDGYKFDDDVADLKIAAITKAQGTLKEYYEFLAMILEVN